MNNIILGDIHGSFQSIYHFVEKGVLDNSTIYQIGDFGLYDLDNDDSIVSKGVLEDLDKILESKNIKLKVIRGNHDNPFYWCNKDARSLFNKTYTNIELIPDYHVEVIGGKSVLFIGGSVSVDRKARTQGKDWWPDECISTPMLDFLQPVDIVIAHNCPSFFNLGSESNTIKWYTKKDPELPSDLIKERQLLDTVFHHVKPSMWYSGHFHNNLKGEQDGCKYMCVDINEFIMFNK